MDFMVRCILADANAELVYISMYQPPGASSRVSWSTRHKGDHTYYQALPLVSTETLLEKLSAQQEAPEGLPSAGEVLSQ